MKFSLLIGMFLLNSLFNNSFAQNLVPNGGFEQLTQCPNSTAQLSYCNNWEFAGASTDYYNSCSPQGNMSIPSNIYGYQEAYEGNAYIGMITSVLHDDDLFYYREPAITNLTQPLIIGTKYYVSFKAVLTVNDFESCCASNKLGALFSTIAYSSSNPIPDNYNFAHVYTDSVISDTINWFKISGSFVADSAYQFISIGNFFDTLNTIMVDFNQDFPLTSSSYYYIDDVRVSTDSLFGLNIEGNIDRNDIVEIYPNPNNGEFTIYSKIINTELKIFNSTGQLVYYDYLESNNKTIAINEILSSGLYLILINPINPIIKKIIIKN